MWGAGRPRCAAARVPPPCPRGLKRHRRQGPDAPATPRPPPLPGHVSGVQQGNGNPRYPGGDLGGQWGWGRKGCSWGGGVADGGGSGGGCGWLASAASATGGEEGGVRSAEARAGWRGWGGGVLPRPHLPSVWQKGPKGGRAGPSRRQPAGAVEIMSARRHAEGGCARGLHLPPAVSRRVLDTRYRWPTALPLSRGGGGPDATQLDASCKGPPARGAAQPPHTSWWLEPNERGRHSQATRPRRLGPQLS